MKINFFDKELDKNSFILQINKRKINKTEYNKRKFTNLSISFIQNIHFKHLIILDLSLLFTSLSNNFDLEFCNEIYDKSINAMIKISQNIFNDYTVFSSDIIKNAFISNIEIINNELVELNKFELNNYLLNRTLDNLLVII